MKTPAKPSDSEDARAEGMSPDTLRYMGLDPAAALGVERVYKQLTRLVRPGGSARQSVPGACPPGRHAQAR